VHDAIQVSLTRTFIVVVISFLIVIICLVTTLGVVAGIFRISSHGNWRGILRSDRSSWCGRGSWRRHLHCWRGRQSSRRSQLSIRVNFQDRFIFCLNEEVRVLWFLLRLDGRGQLCSKRLSPGHLCDEN
jgi:hypothetical protein